VLELILRHGREIVEARALVVFLLEGDELVLAAGCEDDADDAPSAWRSPARWRRERKASSRCGLFRRAE